MSPEPRPLADLDAPALGSVITYPKDLPALGEAFPEWRCFHDPNLGPICVAKRHGACTGSVDPANRIQVRMRASGV
jgi:hypothetical protein